jgi:hypothetical protein
MLPRVARNGWPIPSKTGIQIEALNNRMVLLAKEAIEIHWKKFQRLNSRARAAALYRTSLAMPKKMVLQMLDDGRKWTMRVG